MRRSTGRKREGRPPPDPRVRPLWEGTAAKHPACVSARRRGPADPRPVVSRAFWTMSTPPSPQPRVPVSTKEGRKAGSRQGGAIPASSPRANSKVWEGDGAESRIPRAQKQGAEPGSRASRRLCQRRAEGRQFMAPYLLTSRTSKQNPDLRAVASRNTAPCPGGPACPS